MAISWAFTNNTTYITVQRTAGGTVQSFNCNKQLIKVTYSEPDVFFLFSFPDDLKEHEFIIDYNDVTNLTVSNAADLASKLQNMIDSQPTVYQNSPADPSGTSDATGVMMGLAASITPFKTGAIVIIISGDISNDTPGDSATVQIRYGTGSAPSNGDALTGTTAGNSQTIINPNIASLVPGVEVFSCNAIVTGLTVNTPIWIDLSLDAANGGISAISSISISVFEL